MVVTCVTVGKFSAILTWWSSLVKVLKRILMFLSIFVVSVEDVVFPAVDSMSKRNGCIVDYSHVGVLSTATRSILRM